MHREALAPMPPVPIGYRGTGESRVDRLFEGVRDTLQICADALEATAMYHELDALSDAELQQRGAARQYLLQAVLRRLIRHA